MELIVECTTRAPGTQVRALRRQGMLPAVLYGHQGAQSMLLTTNAKDVENVVRSASINNTLVQVNVTDAPWSGKALLREVQIHPWKPLVYHLSFFSVADQDSLEVTAPLNFVGEAIGVKTGKGALDTVLTELQVQCAPDRIPESIDINVSNMEVGDTIHVHELVLPTGVTSVGEPDRVVVSVLPPKVAEEPSEPATSLEPAVAEALAAMDGETGEE